MSTPYVPNDPGPNPNIANDPPWRLVAILGGGFIAVILAAWFVLGWIGGSLAKQVPDGVEQRLGEFIPVEQMQGQSPELLAARDHLQGIVDVMATELPPRELPYRVIVVEDPTVNAAAVPGGAILVFRGLLDGATSENEVAMILGHEIAHHHHRDLLERLGRQLVVAAVLSSIFGDGGGLEQLGGLGVEGLSRKMGRDDEREADELALDLLDAVYGHVGGSTAFFERMLEDDVDGLMKWASTHPLSAERIDRIIEIAGERGYRFGETQPLPSFESAPTRE